MSEKKVIPFKPESDKEEPEGTEVVIAECCGTCLYWSGNREDHEQNPVALCKGLPPYVTPISAIPEPTKLLTTQQETGKVPLNMKLITVYPKMPYLSAGCALYTPWAAVKKAMELNALFSKAALFPETLTEEETETLAKLKEMNSKPLRGTGDDTTGTPDESGADKE